MTTPGTTVCGFFGHHNLGDEAILAGLCDALDAARPGERTLALTADPRGTRRDFGIDTAYFRPAAPRSSRLPSARPAAEGLRLVETLRSRDGFLLGGGDLLRDSPTQEVVGRWLKPLRWAQRLGRRTAVVGVSVGDLWKRSSEDALRRALDGTSFVVTRDVPSTERLRALDLQVPVETAPDLALRVFTPDDGGSLADPAAPRVLVSVRGLADRGDAAASAAHEHALRTLAEVLDGLVDDGARVELVPFRSLPGQFQPVDDDYVASLELAHRARNGHRFTVHRDVPTVDALRDLLRGARLVVGMRLHSVIMAVGLQIPVLAISYDRKVRNFCHEVGLSEACWDSADVEASVLGRAARAALAGPVRTTTAAAASYRARSELVVDRLRAWG
ncbi:polysaccharide pyruvyl transferase family protein [Kineococcus rhizosphaerae]|uniref:Polysaccharide pyruvyl transferase WcaK-like protein n=1 Tax=Kineococcus rhizosphaerae TaxID=559628 RepID=A0A2T0R0V6_9ACTN|nr:polysaccharide pyruvyl transferase family protein [Kineococcus rhizosphaerae]PRY12952.1 polysaccharide pyruvyl transferase WcaK-like protein [Kineococcus rhizosphaerae]